MLKFFRNLFKSLFGGGATTDAGSSVGTTPPPPPPEKEEQETDTSTETRDGNLIEIERSSPGTKDTLGKLSFNGEFLCYTLENPMATGTPNESNAIPAGTYSLSLRTEGGKHATYLYRFGDLHKGLLQIDGVTGFDFPHLHIGNEASYTYGSIVVGTETQDEAKTNDSRKVLYSEKAYIDVYQKVAPLLEAGTAVQLKIG